MSSPSDLPFKERMQLCISALRVGILSGHAKKMHGEEGVEAAQLFEKTFSDAEKIVERLGDYDSLVTKLANTTENLLLEQITSKKRLAILQELNAILYEPIERYPFMLQEVLTKVREQCPAKQK